MSPGSKMHDRKTRLYMTPTRRANFGSNELNKVRDQHSFGDGSWLLSLDVCDRNPTGFWEEFRLFNYFSFWPEHLSSTFEFLNGLFGIISELSLKSNNTKVLLEFCKCYQRH